MGLTGALKATMRYLRFVYNGITVEVGDPLAHVDYADVPVAGLNQTASGKREALFERMERQVLLTTGFLSSLEARQIERMILEWAGRGKQFECYVDRTLSAWWGFDEDSAVDNNGGNPFTPSTESLTYVILTEGKGVNIPSAGTLIASLISTLTGGGSNAFFSITEGSFVLQFKPNWAFGDSQEHVFFDCVVGITALGKNRLELKKRADNVLHFRYIDRNGMETVIEATPTWSANDEVTILGQWKTLTDLQVKVGTTLYTTRKYPIVASASRIAGTGLVSGQVSATPNGGETTMDVAPTACALGTNYLGIGGRATGACGMFALYRAAYGLPVALGTYQYPWRTYYPMAELADLKAARLRPLPPRELHVYQIRIREGS